MSEMYRQIKAVKLKVNDGPDRVDIHFCTGEIVEFNLMKMTDKFDGISKSSTLYGVLEEPVKISVKVDRIALPLYMNEGEVVGVIERISEQNIVRAGAKDEKGLLYLREGDVVRIFYDARTKTGHLNFESDEWLRMCVPDGTLNFLTTNNYLKRFGRMVEIVQYASLKPGAYAEEICAVRDIAQCAKINKMDPDIYRIKTYDEVQDTLLAVDEQPIILC